MTQFIGWFSQIEQPPIRDLSIAIWRLFADLDLAEAKKAQFSSLHDCLIRELKDGARAIDGRPDVLARAMPLSGPAASSQIPSSIKPGDFPTRCWICFAIRTSSKLTATVVM